MIQVKEAVRRAIEYLRDMNPDLERVRVEEVDISEDDNWLITLGYLEPEAFLGPQIDMTRSRRYKVFTINGSTGDIISMKIREPVNVK